MKKDQKTVLLIYPQGARQRLADLPAAIERAGGLCQQLVLDGDHGLLLDALEGNVIPVVVKG